MPGRAGGGSSLRSGRRRVFTEAPLVDSRIWLRGP